MPTNKNALLRYQVLDRCFSDFHKPEFGIRNTFKKLVISIIFSIFVVENQYIINKEYYHYGDYQRQNYRNFLYYR